MIYGYQKRLYHDYSMNRALRYQLIGMFNSNIPEIYDWEPLDGDPTKEERDRAKKEQAIKAEQDYLTFKKFYEQQGIEVM